MKWKSLSLRLIAGTAVLLAAAVFVTAMLLPEKQSEEGCSTLQKETYVVYIDIEDKKLYVLEGETIVKEYPVASGKRDTPSPIGTWKITGKGSWGGGFGEKWMGLNVPWGTV